MYLFNIFVLLQFIVTIATHIYSRAVVYRRHKVARQGRNTKEKLLPLKKIEVQTENEEEILIIVKKVQLEMKI